MLLFVYLHFVSVVTVEIFQTSCIFLSPPERVNPLVDWWVDRWYYESWFFFFFFSFCQAQILKEDILSAVLHGVACCSSCQLCGCKVLVFLWVRGLEAMVSWAKWQSKAADLVRKWQVGTLGLGNYREKTGLLHDSVVLYLHDRNRGEERRRSFLRHLFGEKLTLNDSFVLGARISCGYDTVRCVWYILALVWSPLFWLGSFHPHFSHMWPILTAGKVTHASVSREGLLCGVLPRTQNLGEISLWSYVFEANKKKKAGRKHVAHEHKCTVKKKKPKQWIRLRPHNI